MAAVDPHDLRINDDLYSTGRAAFESGASALEKPWPETGHIGRAWFSGWLDALAGRTDGGARAARAYPHLAAGDRAELF